jgi:hypothetical protein
MVDIETVSCGFTELYLLAQSVEGRLRNDAHGLLRRLGRVLYATEL